MLLNYMYLGLEEIDSHNPTRGLDFRKKTAEVSSITETSWLLNFI